MHCNRSIRRFLASAVAIATLLTPRIGTAQGEPVAVRAQRLLDAAIQSGSVGSAVGLIARDGRIVFIGAAGQAGPGVPMPTDAIVRLASITKPITATSVMLLVEEGKLKLTDRVDAYLPGFGRVVLGNRSAGEDSLIPVARPVTIYDLLTHTSGIDTDDAEFNPLWENSATAKDFAEAVGRHALRFQPGTRFHYGFMGSSYEVLAGIVEQVSGESFAAFVHRRILEPLRMHDTYFHVPAEKRPRLAAQYRPAASGGLEVYRARGEEEAPTTFYSGGGGLRSTVTDYFRFVQFLLNGGELDGVRLLQRETVAEMLRDHVEKLSPSYGWGFGVSVERGPAGGAEAPGNFGWNGGTGTQFHADPARRLIVVIFAPSTPRSAGVNQLRTAFVLSAFEP